ncbi:hypothetical protein Hanom_Chr04g00366631 [Helianthus anomalus]
MIEGVEVERLCVLALQPLNRRNEQSRLLEVWNRAIAICSIEGNDLILVMETDWSRLLPLPSR